jgi:hypothetical protein
MSFDTVAQVLRRYAAHFLRAGQTPRSTDMATPHFSRIEIVQSLPPDESPTGRKLREAIEQVARFDHGVRVGFFDAPTASCFSSAFERIRDSVADVRDLPVVHVEAHGLSDKSGLYLADGTTVSWARLKASLTDINRLTGCRLLVTLAACHGANIQATLDTQSEAPCWALLGPSGIVSPPDLVSSYSSFFMKLLVERDADVALRALRNAPERQAHYYLRTSEDFFIDVFSLYRKGNGSREDLEGRVARFGAMLKKAGLPIQDKWLRGEMVKSEMQILAKFFTRFFFVDEHPENIDRFKSALLAMKY